MKVVGFSSGGLSSDGIPRRWFSVALVTIAIAISYFDRQTLPVAIAAIQHNIPISDQQFSYLQTAFLLSYAALYVIGGRLLDRFGTRRGFLLIMLWWSMACALHGLAIGFALLLCARFLLGMGEGGGFPAAIRVVAEWMPPEHRSTAVGIINAGTAVGSVLAPPLIGFVLLHSGWRSVFFISGAIGIAWVVWWILSYRSNTSTLSVNTLDVRLLAQKLSMRELLAIRSVQVIVFAKFMSDSAWYFLLFWLPKYLYDARHFDVKQVSYYAWIPYAASGVGSFLGGWFSSWLLQRGYSLDQARKMALGLSCGFHAGGDAGAARSGAAGDCALQHRVLLSAVMVGSDHDAACRHFPALRCGHGLRAGRLWRSDRWRHLRVVAGYLLGHGFGYGTLFVLVGTFHLIGFLAIILLRRQDSTPSKSRSPGDREQRMKITEVRTRVVQWEGKTVPLPPHFCTNPMDLVSYSRTRRWATSPSTAG